MNVSAVLLLLLAIAAVGPCSNQRAVPQPNPRTGYAMELSVDGAAFAPLSVDADGNGCERFSSVEDAERTCFITTNVIPTIIGGEAYGELNERRTPALDALIWRARADADPSVCERGGLSGALLAECQVNAVDPAYTYGNGPFRVRIPLGGSEPVASGAP